MSGGLIMEEQIQPQAIEAEVSVLGAMMMSKETIAIIVGLLKPDYFYRSANGHIFTAILELYRRGEPVDLVTVASQLEKMGELEAVGGRGQLVEIMESVPTAANAERYAHIVLDKAMGRSLIDTGSQIVADAFDETLEVDDVLESAQKSILDISKERVRDEFHKLDAVLKTVFDDIQSVYDKEDNLLGVPSGFPDLDTMTSGFQKADLIILAARPAMGKTTFALNIAMNAAVKHQIPVAVYSLEMPKEQLAMRLLSSESKLDSKRLRTANLHEHEYKSLMHALGVLSDAPIYIDDTAGLSPLELRAKTRRLMVEADVKLILIDYLQLMKGGKRRSESRFHEMSEIVREVKGFAKESGLPIIALSQLSRAVEQRQDKTPQLSDLRETGEIEQTADIVMFIHREDYYDHQLAAGNQASVTDLIIAKHRNGSTGKVNLMFRKDITRFVPADKQPAPAPEMPVA